MLLDTLFIKKTNNLNVRDFISYTGLTIESQPETFDDFFEKVRYETTLSNGDIYIYGVAETDKVLLLLFSGYDFINDDEWIANLSKNLKTDIFLYYIEEFSISYGFALWVQGSLKRKLFVTNGEVVIAEGEIITGEPEDKVKLSKQDMINTAALADIKFRVQDLGSYWICSKRGHHRSGETKA